MEARKELPRLIPELTPELLAEHREHQKEWRRAVTIPSYLQDPDLARALVNDLALRTAVAAYDDNPYGARGVILAREIAERLIEQGEFKFAGEFPLAGKVAELATAYLFAEMAPDDAKCEHYNPTFYNKGESHENWFVERRAIPSHKYGQRVPILRCNVCGFRNMRPLADGEKERFHLDG